MNLRDYALLAPEDVPTLMLPVVVPEPSQDEVEAYILIQLEALFSVPCPRGCVPGTTMTWVEERAEKVRELLDELYAARGIKRFESVNTRQPQRQLKWARE